MGLSIVLTALASRNARDIATDGVGTRRIARDSIIAHPSGSGSIISGLGRFGSSLLSKVWGILTWHPNIDFKFLFSKIFSALGFVWNFNWNITDTELDGLINQALQSVAGALGGTAGYTMGLVVCGAAPAALIAMVNEPLALQILLDLGEEALDELADHIANLIKVTTRSMVQGTAAFVYKNIRSSLRPTGAKLRDKLKAKGKLTQEQIDKAVEQSEKPWSFSSAFNNFIDQTFLNEIIKESIEEFIDEFSSACVDSGYIIANSLDTYYPKFFTGINAALGSTTTISVNPTR